MTKEFSLPDGWKWTTLGEIAELVGGGTPSREHPEYFTGDIVWLTPTEIQKYRLTVVSDSKERITQQGLKNSSARILPKGSVLMTSRASIGYVAIAGTEVTTNQGFASFICNKDIYNYYLAYWLLGNAEFFKEQGTGTTFKEITKSKLRNFSLPLPPLPEQERIVERIESLFTQLDAGVAGLKRVQAALKRYRASVLKAACEGRLIENRGGKRSEGLPAEWRLVTVGEIGKVRGGKRLPAGHIYSDEQTNYAYIRVVDFGDFTIKTDNLKYLKPETQALIKRYTISHDDVFISIAGSIGKIGVIPEHLDGANLTENAAKITNLQGIDNKYRNCLTKLRLKPTRLTAEA